MLSISLNCALLMPIGKKNPQYLILVFCAPYIKSKPVFCSLLKHLTCLLNRMTAVHSVILSSCLEICYIGFDGNTTAANIFSMLLEH